MGTKNNPGQFDCYDELEPDEPYFVLKASDPLAPGIVRVWALRYRTLVERGAKPPENMAKVQEALDVARAMSEYYFRREEQVAD